MEINELTHRVIGCAIAVHKALGPGLLESVYRQCLARELELAGVAFECDKPLPLEYKGLNVDCAYRLDFVVEGRLIVGVKSVEKLQKIHGAQLLTYLKLANLNTGLLINFNELALKNGIKRFVL